MPDNMESARRAIQAVFGDTSVPQETTRERLKELRDEIDMNLDALAE